MSTNHLAAVAGQLSAQIGAEQVLLPGAAGYDRAVFIWNGAVPHRPAVVVRPRTATEVQDAVQTARDHGLALTVRGGGHDWSGRSLSDGGLTIDLSALRDVAVDPEARVAVVDGGATSADVAAAAGVYGLAAATGGVSAVGYAGLTLGGGYGPLMGWAGLALDNLLGAEVVLADGRLVQVSAESEPELFWALRGGGGNFGVVTSLRVRLHEVPTVLAGFIFFPGEQATDVFQGYSELVAEAPDELTVPIGVMGAPDGAPLAFLAPVWSGDPIDGEKWLDQLRELGTPLLAQLAPMSYPEMLALYDPHLVNGRHYAMRTRPLPVASGVAADGAVDAAAIAALVEAGTTRTSPTSALFLQHFHGAPTRVAPDATAFGLRAPHFTVEILAAWEPEESAEAHVAWADRTSEALRPHSLPGGYPNLLGPEAGEQTAEAYGANAPRLLAAKRHYDPDGVFAGIALPPA